MQTNNTIGHYLYSQSSDSNLNGVDGPKDNVRHFSELLFELSKYDPDLKAILDNSKLSVNQNWNTGFRGNPYNMSNGEINSNLNLNNIEGSGENFNPNKDKQSNTEKIDNINENNIAEVTADSIYNLLTSQGIIFIDISKLPEELKQLVNRLVNNNSLDNQNEIKTLNMNSAPPLSGNNISNPDEVVQENQEKLVNLNASQFQELIYYFIINTVAKDRGMSVLSNQNQDNQTYGSILQIMNTNFGSSSTTGAYQAYDRYRKRINTNIDANGNLQDSITNELNKQGISINFWGPFLWDVLKRASFSYSLYKAIRNNHRKDKIDAVLGLPHVLFILSLIFGWGAIASTILGLAVLASLVYKAINQYQQARPKYLLDSLLRTKTFYAIAKGLDRALVPEVGNLYKFYQQKAGQAYNQKAMEIDNFRQYPSLAQHPFGGQSQGYPPNPFDP